MCALHGDRTAARLRRRRVGLADYAGRSRRAGAHVDVVDSVDIVPVTYDRLVAQVPLSRVREECPQEGNKCHVAASVRNLCVGGGDYDATVGWWRDCPCSCTVAGDKRYYQCCEDINRGDRRECMPYCSYKYRKRVHASASFPFYCNSRRTCV